MTQDQIDQVKSGLKRIFSLPMSKMTLREVQNLVATTFPNQHEEAKSILDSLFAGESPKSMADDIRSKFKPLIEEYSAQVRFAREVYEFGEFMNIFSCDFLQQGNKIFFVNRMRRVDGEEYQFLSSPDTNIRLAHMFINRLRDLKQSAGDVKLDEHLLDELRSIKTDIDNVLKK